MAERKVYCLRGDGSLCPPDCDFRSVLEPLIELAAAVKGRSFDEAAATFNQNSTEAARRKLKLAYHEYRCKNDPLM